MKELAWARFARPIATASPLFLALTAGPLHADPLLPRVDGQIHLGVASCSGPCHGRQAALGVARGLSMRGSEIVVWQDLDTLRGRHSQAYKTLKTERSLAIAAKLGIGDPTKADRCLSCHADQPAGSQRGPQLLLSDGVGCEACHGGGGGKWLEAHYGPKATHSQNVANGLYPTDNPAARAKLCQSCHVGAAASDQFVNHRMMAAGHPRMVFETELYTALQAHHYEDQNYNRRKPIPSKAQVWAIGQVAAYTTQVELFITGAHKNAGVFPEETFFDCRSCHRPISDARDAKLRAVTNPGRPIDPGTPVFNDANMIVILPAARAISPWLARDLDEKSHAFHAALTGDPADVKVRGEALLTSLARLQRTFEANPFDAPVMVSVLRGIISEDQTQRYTDYASAEQAIMAVDSLCRSLVDAKRTLPGSADRSAMSSNGPQPPRATPSELPVQREIDAAYKVVADPNAYDQDAFRRAIQAISARLGLS